jgi:hypothetical protein
MPDRDASETPADVARRRAIEAVRLRIEEIRERAARVDQAGAAEDGSASTGSRGHPHGC